MSEKIRLDVILGHTISGAPSEHYTPSSKATSYRGIVCSTAAGFYSSRVLQPDPTFHRLV